MTLPDATATSLSPASPALPETKAKAGPPSSSPNPGHSRLPEIRRLGKGVKFGLAAVTLLVVASGAWATWYFITGGGGARADILLHKVKHEPMQLTVVERGQLESAVNRDVVCRVKAKTQGSTVASTIKWVIDDGSHVKQGQLLVELDASGHQEQLKTQKITLDKAEADKISSEEAYNIAVIQNLSDIKTAETTLILAQIDLKKYLEGEYEQKKKDILGRMDIARSDLLMWEERAAWSARMTKRNYVTPSQAQADSARLQSAKIALQKVEEELRVLEDPNYGEKKRNVTDYQNKVDEARRTLDRVKLQAKSKEVQADADRKAKQSIYVQELSKYNEIEEEIRKCVITAPQDGLVVYFMPEQQRWGMGKQSTVAQGEPVNEGQKLMQIPDLAKMQVSAKVHEALIARVKGERWKRTGFSDGVQAALLNADPMACLLGQFAFGQTRQDFSEKFRAQEQELLYGGQTSQIRVDALNEVGLMRGHVKSVANTASQTDFFASDVKVYQTIISIDESHEGLKPGMSAEVTIYTDSREEDVLAIPVQAALGSPQAGSKRQCYVLKDGVPEVRDITVGMANEKLVEVVSGLEEGEQVILNPKAVLSDKEKAKLAAAAAAAKGGDGKGKGKGDGKGKGRGKGKGGPGGGPGGPGGFSEGRGGPGGGDGPAAGGPGADGQGKQGGFQNMTPEQMKQRFEATVKQYRAASPEQRKQMLQKTPEAYRDRLKEGLKSQGIEIPD